MKKTTVERIFESLGIKDENIIRGWVNQEREDLINFWLNGANAITKYGAEEYYDQVYKGVQIKSYYEPVLDLPKGITKREYFAINALQGLLTNDVVYGRLGITPAAMVAVNYAEALINELDKK